MFRYALPLVALLLVSTLWSQGNPPGKALPPGCGVEQKEVDEAIKKGAEYLKGQCDFGDENSKSELIIYTLLHAGVPVNEKPLSDGIEWLKKIDVSKLDGFERHKTYRVALAAMALGSVGGDANQKKMAQFAYFLVANQCKNGQWSYGDSVEVAKELKTPEAPGAISSGPGKGVKVGGSGGNNGTQLEKRIPINPPRRIGPESGDNSNTQFAVLGLRACADAGSGIPDATWRDALKVESECQMHDGAWGYYAKGFEKGKDSREGYGSMTCSGICDVVICEHFLKMNWKNDPRVASGLAWLGNHFTVIENAKTEVGQGWFADSFHYYYLYALERTGALADTESMGGHAWYREGARYLIDKQEKNGSWKDEHETKGNRVEDTCFAILFLGRATPPVKVSK